MGGIEVLQALRNSKPELPVLVLGDFQDERHVIRVLKEGAWGYLAKGSMPGVFIEAIRKAALRERYISSSLVESLIRKVGTDNPEEPHKRLSNREYQILQMIASSKSIKEIASNLEISNTTVSTYRARVLEKMNMQSNGELIRYAIEHQLELLCRL
jgi:two-component system, NarL family, invasion response regulator UvrY